MIPAVLKIFKVTNFIPPPTLRKIIHHRFSVITIFGTPLRPTVSVTKRAQEQQFLTKGLANPTHGKVVLRPKDATV